MILVMESKQVQDWTVALHQIRVFQEGYQKSFLSSQEEVLALTNLINLYPCDDIYYVVLASITMNNNEREKIFLCTMFWSLQGMMRSQLREQ